MLIPQFIAETLHAKVGQDMIESLKIFKSKAEANIVAMPKALNKIIRCVARMERLEQFSVNIHPFFN